VPDRAGPADEVGFRMAPPPTGHQQIEPDIAWVVSEAVTHGLQANVVAIDGAGREHPEPLLWEGEPVARLELAVDVDGQPLLEVATHAMDLVVDGSTHKP